MRSLLLVDQFAELGGSQRGLLDLLPALQKDFIIEMAAPGPGPLTEELARRGIRWHSLDLGEYALGRKSPRDLLRYALHQPRIVQRLMDLARGKALIYANGPRVFPATAVAARLAGVPLLWCLHLEIESARDRGLLECAASIARPQVVACSQACLNPFAPESAVRRAASIVYIGVDPVVIAETRARDQFVIGTVGRIHPDKGIADLLNAAPEVLAAFPKARFRIVGPRVDDVFFAEMSQQAARLGAGRVEFAGECATPAESLAGVDILVMPSRREAASRVVMESFSAGIPVIASDAGGLPEIVEHNGLLFPRGDARALAAAIIRVLGDPALRSRMALMGREAYARRWRVDRYAREMCAEIEREIARPRQRR